MKNSKNASTNLSNIHIDADSGMDSVLAAFRNDILPAKAVYFLDCDVLRAQCDLFQGEFPGTTAYAVKANYDPQILQTIWESGIRHFDVASLKEIELVSEQFKQEKQKPVYLFHNPWKSEKEIKTAHQRHGVRHFAASSVEEIKKIQSATQGGTDISFSLRLDVGDGGIFSLHEAGAALADAPALLKAVRDGGQTFGWHFHLGSQCEKPEDYANALDKVNGLIAETKILPDYIDIGGGFPASYANQPPLLQKFFAQIEAANIYQVPLICEPGRALVASCQKSVVPIKDVDSARNMVVLTDGRYGSLAEFVASQGKLKPSYSFASLQDKPLARTKTFDVQGPTCNIKGERLPFTLTLPADAGDGDMVVFDDIGAYNVMQQSNFNGYEPETQFVRAGYPHLDKKEKPLWRRTILAWTIAASSLLAAGDFAAHFYKQNKTMAEKSAEKKIEDNEYDYLHQENAIMHNILHLHYGWSHSFDPKADSILKEQTERYKLGLNWYIPHSRQDTLPDP